MKASHLWVLLCCIYIYFFFGVTYVNGIYVGFNFIVQFEYDTKTGNSVISDRDRQSLREDLRKISAWSDRRKMPFNGNKCYILQVETKKSEYEISGVKLESVQCVKDLNCVGSEILPALKRYCM